METRTFATGATRDSDKDKLSYRGFLAPEVLHRYAEFMHMCRLRNIPEGQELRAPDNWKKGMPKQEYVESLIRHTIEAWTQWEQRGEIEQDVLCAIMFNTMGHLYEDLRERNARVPISAEPSAGPALSHTTDIARVHTEERAVQQPATKVEGLSWRSIVGKSGK